MAVHYCYTVEPEVAHHSWVGAAGIRDDGTIVRDLVIPESPDEELRGETYMPEDIEWLHASEHENIKGRLPDGTKITRVWTEEASVNSDGSHDFIKEGKVVKEFSLESAS